MTSWQKKLVVATAAIAVLAALVALGLLLVAATTPSGVPRGPSALPVDDSSFFCPEPCGLYSIAFGGDTMIGQAARKRIKKGGYGYVLEHAPGFVRAANYAIINLEAPLTMSNERPDDGRKFVYRTLPEAGQALADAGVDAIGFANNHTFDRRVQGIANTRKNAKKAGMAFFGAGADRHEAEAPLLVQTPYGNVAIVAFDDIRWGDHEATETQPGTPWLRRATAERMRQRALDAGAKYVVAFVHWGANYASLRNKQKRGAAMLVDAGYDLVIGHGPHVLQPVGILDGVPVVYSLGNFIFNTMGRFGKRNMPGWAVVVTAYLGPDGFEGLELACMQADNQVTLYKPRPCNADELAGAFDVLGPNVRVRGERGVVTW